MKSFLYALVFRLMGTSWASASLRETVAVPWDNLPTKVREALVHLLWRTTIQVCASILFIFAAIWTADGKPGYAILITRKCDQKRGLVVFFSSHAKPHLLGAGTPIQYGASKETDLDSVHLAHCVSNQYRCFDNG